FGAFFFVNKIKDVSSAYYYLLRLISTLLFSFLPAAVLLEAIGRSSPYPIADNLNSSIPWSTKYCFTASALASDRLLFNLSLPVLSVWPSTVNLALGNFSKISVITCNV